MNDHAAVHPTFGRCTVLACLGRDRLIEVECSLSDSSPNVDDLPEGVEPHEVLFSETIWTRVLVVPAKLLDPVA